MCKSIFGRNIYVHSKFSCVHSSHSFTLTISIAPLQVHYYSEALPTTARILYQSFTLKRTATAGKRLAQGPYMAAIAGVKPTTLRLKYIDSSKAPPCPTGEREITSCILREIHEIRGLRALSRSE